MSVIAMVRSSLVASAAADGTAVDVQAAADDAQQANFGDRVVSYIPTEIIGGYQIVVALALQDEGHGATDKTSFTTNLQVGLFLLFWFLTPFIAWLAFGVAKHLQHRSIWRHGRQWPWFSMAIGAVAFPVWVSCLPGTVMLRLSWFQPFIGAIVAVIVAIILGKFAPLYEKP